MVKEWQISANANALLRWKGMKNAVLLIVFLTTANALQAQVPDSIVTQALQEVAADTLPKLTIDTAAVNALTADTAQKKKKKRKPKEERFLYRTFKTNYPNPKVALLSGFAVPSLGQWYNKRWWKTPLVYGGLGASMYYIIANNRNYKRFRDAYILALDNQTHEFSNTRLDASDLQRIRNGYDKNRQISIIVFILVYGIQGAEAFVDAHLRTFDVSDDLSLKIQLKPSSTMSPYELPTYGAGISIQLEKRTPRPTFFVTE